MLCRMGVEANINGRNLEENAHGEAAGCADVLYVKGNSVHTNVFVYKRKL